MVREPAIRLAPNRFLMFTSRLSLDDEPRLAERNS
jgi:hypothetical protein